MSRCRAVMVPCDGCGGTASAQGVGGRITLPEGWLRLHVWVNDDYGALVRRGVVDACSPACAAGALGSQAGIGGDGLEEETTDATATV